MHLHLKHGHTLCLAALLFSVSAVSIACGQELRRRGQIGVQLAPLTDERRSQFEIPADANGILIMGTLPGTGAAEAGLEAGDLIQKIGGMDVATGPQLVEAMSRYFAGDDVPFTLLCEGETITKTVTLKERPREEHDAFEIQYGTVISNGAPLRTLLTKPRTGDKFPAVLFIQGLGCFSMENQPLYLPFINDFTEHGFVTFRVDKPGCGDSQGGPCSESDFHEVVDGYRQALAKLRTIECVDDDNIFIFGHSMGGIIGPILAAETDVQGLIVYGTGFRTWIEYVFENNRRQAILEGTSQAEIEEAIRMETLFAGEFYLAKKSPSEIIAAHPELREYVTAQYQEEKYLYGRHYKFFQQLYDVPAAETWGKVSAHVLALWGKSDFVSDGVDHQLIADTVNAAHPGHGEYKALDGIDHWFRNAKSQEESFRVRMAGTFKPDIVDVIRNWMLEQK